MKFQNLFGPPKAAWGIFMKIKSIITILLAVLTVLVSCGPADIITGETDTENPFTKTADDTKNQTGEETIGITSAVKEETNLNSTPKTLKILAIGNSFSTDGMQYLYDIAKSAGVEEIVLGNLYIGGCSLSTHLSHAKVGDAAYTYYKNTNGTWIAYSDKTLMHGLTDEVWDYISMQQSSPLSGIASTYGNILSQLVEYVKLNKTNPDAKLVWHMTWAYQSDSTHSAFPSYDKNQMTMYNAIVETVKNCIVPVSDFTIIIPTGTAIQNARTSFTGDILTRDGYHLNYNLGRYIAGLAWYAAVTGSPIDDILYNPAISEITIDVMAMAKESVKNAVLSPYEVTASTFKTGVWSPVTVRNSDPVIPADCFEADMSLAATIGIDLSKYTLFNYEYKENSYWYCTKGTSITTPTSGASTYQENICSAKIYSKSEIPENAIIICDTGWQYRPELWESLTIAAKTRPAMTTANITLMNAAFWGSSNYFAFNIAANPKANISAYYASAATHIRIYIPKA